MKLRYKFKIDSILKYWDIPARIYCMAATLFFLIPFYVIGFLSVRDDLPRKTGIVHGIRILETSHSGWEVNFSLEGDTNHIYWQGYENSYPSFYFLQNINSTTMKLTKVIPSLSLLIKLKKVII